MPYGNSFLFVENNHESQAVIRSNRGLGRIASRSRSVATHLRSDLPLTTTVSRPRERGAVLLRSDFRADDVVEHLGTDVRSEWSATSAMPRRVERSIPAAATTDQRSRTKASCSGRLRPGGEAVSPLVGTHETMGRGECGE